MLLIRRKEMTRLPVVMATMSYMEKQVMTRSTGIHQEEEVMILSTGGREMMYIFWILPLIAYLNTPTRELILFGWIFPTQL